MELNILRCKRIWKIQKSKIIMPKSEVYLYFFMERSNLSGQFFILAKSLLSSSGNITEGTNFLASSKSIVA